MAGTIRGWRRAGALAVTAALATSGAAFSLAGCNATQGQAEQPGAEQPAGDQPADEQQGGLVAEGNGYTLAVDDVRVDENGCGSASFTLSNPDGVGALEGDGTDVVIDGTAGLDAIQMRLGADVQPNVRLSYDAGASSDTELVGTVHFDTRSLASLDEGLSWQLVWHEGEGTTAQAQEASTEPAADVPVTPARALADDAGATGSLSPLGIVLNAGVDPEEGQFVDSRVTLRMTDGSEVVVFGADGATSATQSAREDGSTSYAFDADVPVDDVESVTLEGTRLTVGGEQAETHTLTPAS